ADQEADPPDLAAEDLPEDEADHDAVEQRVREAEAGPTAVELRRVVRLQVPGPEADSVDEPLRHQVGRVGTDEERHEGDPHPRVALDRVGLEVVSRPAHRSRRRIAAGRSQAASSRKTAATNHEYRNVGWRTPIVT